MRITLNGDPHEVAGPLTIAELLNRLDIDPRRVAVEHNLMVLKRDAFDRTTVKEGDEVEIVNFVGGGSTGNTDKDTEERGTDVGPAHHCG